VTELISTPQGSRALLIRLLTPYRKRIGVAMLIAVVENAIGIAPPLVIAMAIDKGLPLAGEGDWMPLLWSITGYTTAAIVGAAAKYVFLRYSGRIAQTVLYDLRLFLFERIQRSSQAFQDDYRSGPLISRMSNDIGALNDLLEMGLDGLFSALLSMVIIIAAMLWLDLPLGAIVLCGLLPLWQLVRWFNRRSTQTYCLVRTAKAKLTAALLADIENARAVKAFRREVWHEAIVADADAEYRSAKTATGLLNGQFVGGVVLLRNITLLLVVMVGAVRFGAGELELGVLTAFVLYVHRLFDPIDDLASFANSYAAASAALEKIAELVQHRAGLPEPEYSVALPRTGTAIEFSGVRFRYQEDGPWILDRLDLSLFHGQTVALVGHTGAGKSTVAKLAARFYDPNEGLVSVHGVDLRFVAETALHEWLLVLPQEPFLFSGTIADNIAIGDPKADRAQIESAARAVGADAFISELPKGYDTDIYKRGGRLSAGQRQLITLARVVLADPTILILDEATSALDTQAEQAVHAATKRIVGDRTTLIIAHRLSTVMDADRVLVLADGRVVADGAPAELCRNGNPLHELIKSVSDRSVDREAVS
jgi:ATP-binding cassette, subfamily B, bacterial